MLEGSPFHNYLIPGLTLLILLGIVPTISFWGLLLISLLIHLRVYSAYTMISIGAGLMHYIQVL